MKTSSVSPCEFHETEIVWKEGDLLLAVACHYIFFSFTDLPYVPTYYYLMHSGSAFLAKTDTTSFVWKLLPYCICSELHKFFIAIGIAVNFLIACDYSLLSPADCELQQRTG